jgi:hypothetical protein
MGVCFFRIIMTVRLPEMPSLEQFTYKRTAKPTDKHTAHEANEYSAEAGYTRTDYDPYDAADNYADKGGNDNTGFPGRSMRTLSGWNAFTLLKQHFSISGLLVLERITPSVGGNWIGTVFHINQSCVHMIISAPRSSSIGT